MTSPRVLPPVFLFALLVCAAACNRPAPEAAPSTPPGTAPATPPAAPASTPDKQGVTFGEGFHKEEAGAATLRWVRRDAALRVSAPDAGRYQLTFRPFTVFSTVENTVEVSVNGQAAGTFSTHAFDLTHPTPTMLAASLRAGDNDVRLHSRGAEVRLSDTDDRLAAYGLVVPLTVERLP